MLWETVIGLEVHAQLSTKSKIFSGASTAYGAEANSQACAIDLGFPGVLPVLNEEAVVMAVKFGLAINAEIAPFSVFARKNYFYPDLPKGYQISQFELPIVGKGVLHIVDEHGAQRTIGITRAHLEEDAGKSVHGVLQGLTGIDLNRAGTPLLEIVSEPDLRSAHEAVVYAKSLHSLVRYIGICDGNMQEGSFRCDANVSVRPKGQEEFGTRAEIKNLNSFRFLDRAINHEVERQIEILESGGMVVQETRLYDSEKDETRSMRSKEEAFDYRYFPDPDLLPVEIDEGLKQSLASTLPELPDEKFNRYCKALGLSADDAAQIVANRDDAEFFEKTLSEGCENPKMVANWLTGNLMAALNREALDINQSPVTPVMMAGMIQRIEDGTISGKLAKQVFDAMWQGMGDADQVIDELGLKQITDVSAIEDLIDEVIAANPGQVADYRGGKDKLFGFFVGQIMKASKGKANPGQVNEILRRKLDG